MHNEELLPFGNNAFKNKNKKNNNKKTPPKFIMSNMHLTVKK